MKGLNVMEKSQLANWYAFSTKRSEEFRAARHLSEQSVTTFLPYQTTTVNHARKLTYRKKPLFPGYIFANVDLNEISITTLCSTRGVSGIFWIRIFQLFFPDIFRSFIMIQLLQGAYKCGLTY